MLCGAMKGVPLERALSKLGLASRRESRALLLAGRVRVNGRIVRDPLRPVIPENLRLTIDNARVDRPESVLIAFHKPRGVVTTRHDPAGRPTVYDFLKDVPTHVIPVGRLDLASTGLLLLTNDTRLADWLTDPANRIVRRYLVTVRGELDGEVVERLEAGIDDRGERLTASHVAVRKRSGRETHLVVELVEGRNREIRRMFRALGRDVTRLKRVAFAGIELGNLAPGRWRHLAADQLRDSGPLTRKARQRDPTRNRSRAQQPNNF
jgi:23S rRNA pseudouridine2605 synthase